MDNISRILIPVLILRREGEERRLAEGAEQQQPLPGGLFPSGSLEPPSQSWKKLRPGDGRRLVCISRVASDAHQKADDMASLPCSVSRLTACLPLVLWVPCFRSVMRGVYLSRFYCNFRKRAAFRRLAWVWAFCHHLEGAGRT